MTLLIKLFYYEIKYPGKGNRKSEKNERESGNPFWREEEDCSKKREIFSQERIDQKRFGRENTKRDVSVFFYFYQFLNKVNRSIHRFYVLRISDKDIPKYVFLFTNFSIRLTGLYMRLMYWE